MSLDPYRRSARVESGAVREQERQVRLSRELEQGRDGRIYRSIRGRPFSLVPGQIMDVVTPAHGIGRAGLRRLNGGKVECELAELSEQREVRVRGPTAEQKRLIGNAPLERVENDLGDTHEHGKIWLRTADERVAADLPRLEIVTGRIKSLAAAAEALIGTDLNDDALEAAAAACRAACNPINDKRGTIDYRTKVSGVLMTRAAKIALQRARS